MQQRMNWYRDNSSRIWNLPGCVVFWRTSPLPNEVEVDSDGPRERFTTCLFVEVETCNDPSGAVVLDVASLVSSAANDKRASISRDKETVGNYGKTAWTWPRILSLTTLLILGSLVLLNILVEDAHSMIVESIGLIVLVSWIVYMCVRKPVPGHVPFLVDRHRLISHRLGHATNNGMNDHLVRDIMQQAEIPAEVTLVESGRTGSDDPLYRRIRYCITNKFWHFKSNCQEWRVWIGQTPQKARQWISCFITRIKQFFKDHKEAMSCVAGVTCFSGSVCAFNVSLWTVMGVRLPTWYWATSIVLMSLCCICTCLSYWFSPRRERRPLDHLDDPDEGCCCCL